MHGAGYAVRERAGTKKNPALARLATGRYANLDTLAALAPVDDRALYWLMMRCLHVEIDRMAKGLVPPRRTQNERSLLQGNDHD